VSPSVLWRCAFRDSSRSFWRSLRSSGLSGKRSDFGSRSTTLPALELNTHTPVTLSDKYWRRLTFPHLTEKLHRPSTEFHSPSLRRSPHSRLSAAVCVSGGPFFWRNYVQCLRVPHHHNRPIWAELWQPCNNLLDILAAAVTPCTFLESCSVPSDKALAVSLSKPNR
jgi:hypothetical protein